MSHSLVLAAAAAAKKTPFIDWTALGKVAGVSIVFGIAIVTIFSVGIVGLSWYHGSPAADGPAAASAGPGGGAAMAGAGGGAASRPAGLAMASVSFVLCIGAVVYGLYLIIPQFH
jgi:hypothetical protein